LNKIARRISTTFDQDRILRSVIRLAAESLQTPNAVLMLRKADGWIPRHEYGQPGAASEDDRERLRERLVVIGESPHVQALEDMLNDGRLEPLLSQKTGVRSALLVPLLTRGAISGLMMFFDLKVRHFSPVERDFAGKVAAALSVAWENARLYETQLRMADTLQTALLTMPDEAPGVRFGHLHRSATAEASIGADFYDLFVLAPDRLGLLIGDVSGKGVEGAAAASLVKNVLKAYAYQLDSPGEIMQRANDMLIVNSPSGGFSTALLAIVDLKWHSLAYCNAGHPPPLLKRANGELRVLPTGSPVLGVLPGAPFASREEALHPGDLLLLYTDGVTEARRSGESGEQQFFGEERLARALARLAGTADEVPALIYREVAEFSEGDLADDLALICLELTR
jgi:hypothetical protein